MESKPSETQQDLKRNQIFSEIAAKLAEGKVVTQVVREDELPLYLNAASTTGFKVERIAGEGDEFPHVSLNLESVGLVNLGDGVIGFKASNIKAIKATGKGCIGISIERPETARDYSPFWDELKSLEQVQASLSQKST